MAHDLFAHLRAMEDSGRFIHIDEGDRKGRILVAWDDKHPESGRPYSMSMTAFRSNVDESVYFVALADWAADGEGPRSESTGYVDAKTAAMLSKAFADIAAKLS